MSNSIPIQCQACGATGEVLRVTANLQCRCGSNDLDLWDGQHVAAQGGTGWNQDRPDPDANWSDYVGPAATANPGITQKHDFDGTHICQACHGTGSDPRASGGGYEENVCRNCHGKGHVTYTTENDTPSLDAHVPSGPPLGAGSNGHAAKRRTAKEDTSTRRDLGPAGRKMREKDWDDEDIKRAHEDAEAEEEYERKHSSRVAVPGMRGNKMVTASQGDKIMRMAAKIVETNSGLSTEEAFELARRAVASFPEDGDK